MPDILGDPVTITQRPAQSLAHIYVNCEPWKSPADYSVRWIWGAHEVDAAGNNVASEPLNPSEDFSRSFTQMDGLSVTLTGGKTISRDEYAEATKLFGYLVLGHKKAGTGPFAPPEPRAEP